MSFRKTMKFSIKHLVSCIFLLFLSSFLFAQHYKKDGTPDRRFKENRTTKASHKYSGSTYHKSRSHYYGQRDKKGRIKRSMAAKRKFMKLSGYPHGRPGYVVDHIIPLKDGGCDCPSNMQWQTKAAAKAKDKWEVP